MRELGVHLGLLLAFGTHAGSALAWPDPIPGATRGADLLFTFLDANPRPEAILAVSDPDGNVTLSVGFNLDENGEAATFSNALATINGLPGMGLGAAIGNLDADSKPELILFTVDESTGALLYKVVFNIRRTGAPSTWDVSARSSTAAGWNGAVTEVDGVLTNLDGDPRPDLLVAAVDSSTGALVYTIGFNLDLIGRPRSWAGPNTSGLIGDPAGGIGIGIANLVPTFGRISWRCSSGLRTITGSDPSPITPAGISTRQARRRTGRATLPRRALTSPTG